MAYLHDLALQQQNEAGMLASSVRTLAGLPPWLLGLATLAVLLAWAALPSAPWRIGWPARWLGALVVAIIGFAGMGVNILLLLLAQQTLGALYHLLGALLALGMAGIAAGACYGTRLPAVRLPLPPLIALGLVLLSAAFAGVASAWPFAATLLVLGSLTLLSGVTVGMTFPLALGAGLAPEAVYVADLLGAATAGLLTGVILLPRSGLPGTCALLAALLVLALLAALVLIKRVKSEE